MEMTRDDLAARVAELQAKMTPGPWEWTEIDPDDPDWGVFEVFAPTPDGKDDGDFISTNTFGTANAAAIALLPDLMRDYLAALAELDEIAERKLYSRRKLETDLADAKAELARIRSALDVQPVTVADAAKVLLADMDAPEREGNPWGAVFWALRKHAHENRAVQMKAALRALAKGDDHE